MCESVKLLLEFIYLKLIITIYSKIRTDSYCKHLPRNKGSREPLFSSLDPNHSITDCKLLLDANTSWNRVVVLRETLSDIETFLVQWGGKQ